MLPACLAGAFPTLQVGIFLHHVGVKIILPLRQVCPVADNLLSAQAVVLCQRNKGQMQVGRFLVHVYHRRHDIFPPYPVGEEIRRPLEKRLYLLWGFPLENSGLAVISVSTNRVLSLRVRHPACSIRL